MAAPSARARLLAVSGRRRLIAACSGIEDELECRENAATARNARSA
jgi:hypothetical protein